MGAKPKILVSFPNQGWVRIEVALWFAALSGDERYELRATFPQFTPYENSLHHCARLVVNDGYDYWLNMDADNPPTDNPLNYVEADYDFLGFPTPMNKRVNDRVVVVWNVQRDGGFSARTGSGVEQVEAIGTGCFLVARRVVETIPALFARDVDADGCVVKGNDIAACERMHAAGFKVWCAWDNVCSHYREFDLSVLMKLPDPKANGKAIRLQEVTK